jgi:hypothetical protein
VTNAFGRRIIIVSGERRGGGRTGGGVVFPAPLSLPGRGKGV